MPNSKIIDGRLHVQDDNGVYKSNSADNFNVPDYMKGRNGDRVQFEVMTKGKKTEDGKSVKCKLPVEMDGERKMIGIDLDEDSACGSWYNSSGRRDEYFARVHLNAHDRLVASVKDKDGSVDKVEFTVGRIAELNNEAWKSYVAEKIADTVPHNEYEEAHRSWLLKTIADKVPHTDNTVPHTDNTVPYDDDDFWASLAERAERDPDKYPDRWNVDPAFGLAYGSDESQSDGMVMPNSKVIDGRLHVQDDNGVYKRMPASYDEANSAKNPNVPDVMKNDGNVLLKVITKGERTEDGKSIKCKLPVEIGGERKMIGLDLDADKMDTTRETQKNNAYFNLDAHDRLVASVKDKDGSVDKVEFTVGRIAELNNEAWKSYTAEKIADTVPYTDKSVDMSKYPETQEFLASKFDPAKAKELAERMTVPYTDKSVDMSKYPETQEFLASKFDPAKAKELAERMTVPYTDKSVDMSKYPETQEFLASKFDPAKAKELAERMTVPYTDKSVDMSKYPETQEFLASKFDPAKAKELAERMSASNPEKKHEKVQDTVPYGDGSKYSKSTLADEYPETQAMLNAKRDRYNVDAALGLSDESNDTEKSKSDDTEFE